MRTLLVSALVASASAFYGDSEYGDVPITDLVGGDICSAKAQAFLAVSAPGKECDPVKVDWCSHATCKTSTSSFYEACKADPAYGPAVTAFESLILWAISGCDPSATEGASRIRLVACSDSASQASLMCVSQPRPPPRSRAPRLPSKCWPRTPQCWPRTRKGYAVPA